MKGNTGYMKIGGGFFLVVLLLFIGTASCTYHENKYVEPEIPEVVSLSEDMIPIFDLSCNYAGCHNAGGIPPDLTEANAYTSLTDGGFVGDDDPESSKLYQSIDGGTMEKYATDQDRAIILRWIEQGAENN